LAEQRKLMSMPEQKKSARETTTRDRIIEAALETIREEGFAGTTARAIAARGGFNQALIFYHFGSVSALLLEAFRATSEVQVAKYKAAATEVSSLSDLVDIARRLHEEDMESGAVTAVTQLMAAAASDPDAGRAMLDRFDGWIELVESALRGALEKHPLGAFVPVREAAYAICAMFLGIELMSRLDPERSEADAVFEMMSSMAQLVQTFLPSLLPSAE
jgi:AcrR family transcriptional regulator